MRRVLSTGLTAAALLLVGAAPAQSEATGGAAPGGDAARPEGTGGAGVQAKEASKPKPKPKRPKAKPLDKAPKPPAVDPEPPRAPVDRGPARAYAFPVRGAHSFGSTDTRFGAGRPGRTHQGQDIIAPAGTPLVSPTSGTVLYVAYQASGAGHYVVIRGADSRDYVLMHLEQATELEQGDSVRVGQRVGTVGSTGRASGPNLHFEIWVGGWYAKGGAPIDPLAELQRWKR